MGWFLETLLGRRSTESPTLYRQGDVLLIRVDAPPAGARKRDRRGERIVLALGEATGHAHAVEDLHVEAYERDGQLYLRIPNEPALLRHEEHAPIELPPGSYEVRRQREYAPEEPWPRLSPEERWRWVED